MVLQKHQGRGMLDRRTAKYVLFLDLKAAYDSVPHELLFSKLQAYGVSPVLINAVKTLYSSARLKISKDDAQVINVNKGLLQGSILSPVMFNVFIDSLVIGLQRVGYSVLAFADDIAVVVQGTTKLKEVIGVIKLWESSHQMSVNYAKSGILYVDGRPEEREIDGFPVVTSYKYLGVTVNGKLNPKEHISNVNMTLATYLNRHSWLRRQAFSLHSLSTIHNYWQRSRLQYGLCAFLDFESEIKKLDKNASKLARNILQATRLKIGEGLYGLLGQQAPSEALLLRYKKTAAAYRAHFGVEVSYMDDTLNKRLQQVNQTMGVHLTTAEFKSGDTKQIDELLKGASCIRILSKYSDQVSPQLWKILQRHWWRWAASRDILLIKLLCRVGWLSNSSYIRDCACGAKNIDHMHLINECPRSIGVRTLVDSSSLGMHVVEGNYYGAVSDLFFSKQAGLNKTEVGRVIAFFHKLKERLSFIQPHQEVEKIIN